MQRRTDPRPLQVEARWVVSKVRLPSSGSSSTSFDADMVRWTRAQEGEQGAAEGVADSGQNVANGEAADMLGLRGDSGHSGVSIAAVEELAGVAVVVGGWALDCPRNREPRRLWQQRQR